MNFLKNLLISTALTLSRYMPAQDKGVLEDTTQGEVEPEREMDEWDYLMHHDDVTPEEEAMLFSNDPELIHEAQEQIFQRQREFLEVWENKEALRGMFQAPYLKNADLEKPQTPMHEREGWEDDDDMPETFVGINEHTGELEEIRFDDLEEWRNPNV